MVDNMVQNSINRRKYLKHLGVIGFGTIAMTNTTANTDAAPITSAEFDYRFKTFGATEEIRIGMIGTTGHTSTILGELNEVNNVKLVTYSNCENSNIKLPENVRIYKEYEEMLDKEDIDVVGVCMPYYLNATASVAVAEKKIHVITEKPVAITMADLKKLLAAVKKNKVRLTTLLSMRLDPQYQAIHNAVAEGKIGEPILATAQKSYRFGESRPEFYKKIETYGGTIPWIGIHTLDYIHYTTQLDYTRVVAFQGNKDHPDYPGFQDYAGMLLEMNNGGTAMVNLDYLRPETAPTHGDDRLRIVGSEGVVEIKDLGERVELITSTQGLYDIELPARKSFFADFISELRGQGKHVLSPEEPFEMTRVSLLAHQSAVNNTIINL
ncbi:MAG: Gfo/Idh/MocA family oxidoreductase [Candidatus Latescibacteria bacterium]|nr:Gfo/Idh/MocA family oxidoreductase [Candidatus Latescibacterota bacterium]